MQQIISFLLRNKHSLLFLFLLSIALGLTIQSHSYHKSRFLHSANFLSGGVYASATSVKDYFHLKTYNKQLLDENARLRSYIRHSQENEEGIAIDSAFAKALTTTTDTVQFEFLPAQVIDNNYAGTTNNITIRGGQRDSIKAEMGVITSNGIVGIISHSGTKYSTILSILNTNFSTNAKLKNSDHTGPLSWGGKDPNEMLLSDIQQQAPVAVGDTIETSGNSAYFPKGIPIGTIQEAVLDKSDNFYSIRIRLFNDMTSLGHVYIIKNNDRKQIKALEAIANDEE